MVMVSAVVQCLLSGMYKVKELPGDEFEEELEKLIQNPCDDHIKKIRDILKKLYGDDPSYKGKYIIAMLVVNQHEKGMDVRNTIKNYFVSPDDSTVEDIMKMIKEG